MTDPRQSATNDREKERRPYAAPVIVSREPLEAMAAICSPRPPAKGNAGLCPRGPINS
jgi:hypothetical protein